MALELAKHNPVYEDIASKFFEVLLCVPAAFENNTKTISILYSLLTL